MKQTGPAFPRFNRMVVLVVCSAMLVGMLALLASSKFRQDLNVVTGVLYVAFVAMFFWGIWISLRWQNEPAEDIEENLSIPENATLCRFMTAATKWASVVLDPNAETLEFRNCHLPRRFLALAESSFCCPLKNVKAIYLFHNEGHESLTIVTAAGKALIPDTATHYAELREWITQAVPVNEPGNSIDDPRMGFVYVVGAVIGLFSGYFFTPDNADNNTLGLFVLFGTIAGVIASHGLVVLGDRLFRRNFIVPACFSLIGGVSLAGAVGPFLGWNTWALVAVALGGMILGTLVGRRTTFSKSQGVEIHE